MELALAKVGFVRLHIFHPSVVSSSNLSTVLCSRGSWLFFPDKVAFLLRRKCNNCSSAVFVSVLPRDSLSTFQRNLQYVFLHIVRCPLSTSLEIV